ncbi:Fe(3+) ABC transporter substrate-binding protein [Thermoflexibacter ruber]|uniref:Iron(III) transport system substrate-binding protein n=1 Tax=Thermoflexibacter ruber TaxID=1003 RepID=A0A1I2FIY0_9BACT|nr:Fe(3+) ABC transporter substrate-binding protein [Thermoflexibacter ruber]SFF04728.1 iron(III) transport system substrate-binding protein [Thermoflexibacter ruber]
MKIKHISFLACWITAFLFTACGSQTTNESQSTTTLSQEVNVYTHRHYDSDVLLFEEFTKQTGIKVNVIKANADELMQRMEMEGENSPADVLLTVDAGRLYRAKEKGLLQPISSEVIKQNVPAYLIDKDDYWVALTQRGRVIVYAKDKVNPQELSTYQALTDNKWKKKILVRSSDNIYNQSLLASIIAHEGEQAAKKWAEGIVKNMARDPKGNDNDQVTALVAGEGDLAIVNTYYVAKMLAEAPNAKEIAGKIGVFFPNQNTYGAHFNVSGGGVAKYAPHKENAIKLLEFLTSEKAQQIFAEANQEYPIKSGINISPTLQSFGTFKADTIDLDLLGKYNSTAVKIFDQVGWK